MSTAKRLIENSTVLIAQKLLMQIIAVFVIGYIAAQVGVEQYGIFVFSLSFLTMFGVLANLGTRVYANKEIASDRKNASTIFPRVCILRIFLAFAASLAAIIAVKILPYSDQERLLVYIAAFSQFFAWTYVNTFIVYEAYERMTYPVAIDMAIRVFVLAGSLISVLMGYGILGLALCYAVGNLVEIFVSFRLLHRNFFRPVYKIEKLEVYVSILKQALPYSIIGVFASLMGEADKVMLSLMEGPFAVGLYGVAATIFTRLAGITDAFSTALFPVIMRLQKNGVEDGYRRNMTEVLVIMLTVSMPLAVGVAIFAEEIIALIYRSDEFQPASTALLYLSVAIPIQSVTFLFGFSLIGENKKSLLVKINGFILCLNLMLNYFLISMYNFKGAALATLICIAVKMVLNIRYALHIVNYNKLFPAVPIIFVANGILALIIIGLKGYGWLLPLLVGPIIYASIIFGTNTISAKRIYTTLKSKS